MSVTPDAIRNLWTNLKPTGKAERVPGQRFSGCANCWKQPAPESVSLRIAASRLKAKQSSRGFGERSRDETRLCPASSDLFTGSKPLLYFPQRTTIFVAPL